MANYMYKYMNYNDHNDEEIHQNLDVYANTRTWIDEAKP